MKRARIKRRNPDPKPLVEVEPPLGLAQRIRPFTGDSFPGRAVASDEARPRPDERADEASEPRAERPPEPETTPVGSGEPAEQRARRPTQSQTGLPRQTAQPHEHEAAHMRAAAERGSALAEREARFRSADPSLRRAGGYADVEDMETEA